MTLVLTAVSHFSVVQVSDRLVTLSPTGTEYDTLANKTVVFQASDGLITFAYSGPAYLEGKTTDRWIAERLWGEDLGKRAVLAITEAPHQVDIRMAATVLRGELERALAETPVARRHHCYVAVGGVELRRRRLHPVGLELHNYTDQAKSRVAIRRPVPRKLGRYQFSLFYNPYVMTDDEVAAVRRAVRASDGADDIEAALVTCVRGVAARGETSVGQDCMVVTMRAGPVPVRVRYVPSSDSFAVLGEGALAGIAEGPGRSMAGTRVPVAYSPFLLTAGALHFPSTMVGSFEFHGGVLIALEAPEPGVQRGALSSLERKPEP